MDGLDPSEAARDDVLPTHAADEMSQPTASTRPAVWMILGAFSLATMGTLTHAIGERCDWMTIAFVRVAFMFVSTVVAARAGGATLVLWQPRTLWVRSLAGSFSLVCSFYALTRLPVGDVVTLTNTYPLWIVVLTCLAARRAPVLGDTLSVLVGVAGVALVGQPHLSGDHLAAVVALVSSISSAVAMIGLHKLRGVDSRAVVAHFAGVASIVAAVGYGTRHGSSPLAIGSVGSTSLASAFDPLTLLLLGGVGLSGTIGQVFLTKAYAAGVPTKVSVLALTQVLFAVGFDVFLWHRPIPGASLLGCILILAPTAWIIARNGRPTPGVNESSPADA
jgi:drug/metabolite transporter (DMT)-like permease